MRLLRLLLFAIPMLSGILMLNYAMDCRIENPNIVAVTVRQGSLLLGFFLFLFPLAILYTKASGGLKRADLKLLDWALLFFSLSLMPIFEVIESSLLLWILFVFLPAVITRGIITCYLEVRSYPVWICLICLVGFCILFLPFLLPFLS